MPLRPASTAGCFLVLEYMTDDEINAMVAQLLALPEEAQVMSIRALFESLPVERQQVLRELMRNAGVGLSPIAPGHRDGRNPARNHSSAT